MINTFNINNSWLQIPLSTQYTQLFEGKEELHIIYIYI